MILQSRRRQQRSPNPRQMRNQRSDALHHFSIASSPFKVLFDATADQSQFQRS